MGQLKITELKPLQISVEPKTNLLVLKQGDSEVKITRDHVINMKRLRDGSLPYDGFTSNLMPRNRFTIDDNGTITITCKDEWEDNEVIVANHKKLDDLKRIQDFVDKHKRVLAWERDFKGRR